MRPSEGGEERAGQAPGARVPHRARVVLLGEGRSQALHHGGVEIHAKRDDSSRRERDVFGGVFVAARKRIRGLGGSLLQETGKRVRGDEQHVARLQRVAPLLLYLVSERRGDGGTVIRVLKLLRFSRVSSVCV